MRGGSSAQEIMKKTQLGASLPYNGTGVANRIRRCRMFGSCSSSQHTVLLSPGSRLEPKQTHTGKETARGHFAKKSSSKQSKSRLFSAPGGQQPSPQGSGQTEVREGNMVLVWGGGRGEKSDSVHTAAQLLKQCCVCPKDKHFWTNIRKLSLEA